MQIRDAGLGSNKGWGTLFKCSTLFVSATALFLAACSSEPAEDQQTDVAEETMTADQPQLSEAAIAYRTLNETFVADAEASGEWEKTESGLLFKVLDAGQADGPKPVLGDVVQVNFAVSLADGSEIDSTYDRERPAILQLTEAIFPGWVEGMQMMPEGASYEFILPANLAAGERSVGPIAPFSAIQLKLDVVNVMDEDEIKAETDRLKAERERLQEERKAEMADYIAKQEKFLEDNKAKEGVTTTESGLQYEVLESGDPSNPQATMQTRVEVHYEGTLIDGTVFDSSYKRGETIVFHPAQVIRGWTEVLQLMRPGDKWLVTIPQDIAYGSGGSGSIPPYSTLVFTIELKEIFDANNVPSKDWETAEDVETSSEG